MMQIGIIAALPAELHPLVREWPRTDQVSVGQIGGVQCFAAAEGMGAAAATRSFAAVRSAAGVLDAVVSYGWAGALTCGLQAPTVHTLASVVDARTGERYVTASPPPQNGAPLRLVTLGHVARADEKRALAERYQAVLVDMEAATVARLAQARGIDFYCVKGISDSYTDVLPDFNPFLDARGQLRMLGFGAHALLRPRFWPALMRLGSNSKEAAQQLAQALPTCFAEAGLLSY